MPSGSWAAKANATVAATRAARVAEAEAEAERAMLASARAAAERAEAETVSVAVESAEAERDVELAMAKTADASSLEIFSLDDIIGKRLDGCKGGKLSALKLDVEGFELFALTGLRHTIQSHRVSNILFEFGGADRWAAHSQSAADGERALRSITKAGYQMRFMHTHFVASILNRRAARKWKVVRFPDFSYSIVPAHDLHELCLATGDINLWASLDY